MISRLSQLGPGIVFAAMAVGVSHLVQSTRAGAEYGFSVLGLLILVNLLKYPLFRFANTYSAATGLSLLDGYRKIGRPAVALLILSVLLDMFIAAAAVSLVTAGIVKSVTGIAASNLIIVAVLGALIFLIVMSSAYRLFEGITMGLVLLLLCLTLVATFMVLPTAIKAGPAIFPALVLTPEVILLLIAMAGWMPNPPSASFFLSEWAAARHKASDNAASSYAGKEAIFDINCGYSLSTLIAICFAVMGAVLIFLTEASINLKSATGFADAFIQLFTGTFGNWARPIIGTAAILAMLSTMMTLFDGAPRLMRGALGISEDNRLVFCLMFAGQLLGVLLIIALFASSFRTFIDFITSVSFATAPFIAYFNHKLMFSEDVPEDIKPNKALWVWSYTGIAFMALCGLYFFVMSIRG